MPPETHVRLDEPALQFFRVSELNLAFFSDKTANLPVLPRGRAAGFHIRPARQPLGLKEPVEWHRIPASTAVPRSACPVRSDHAMKKTYTMDDLSGLRLQVVHAITLDRYSLESYPRFDAA